jgi:hypothetical protein
MKRTVLVAGTHDWGIGDPPVGGRWYAPGSPWVEAAQAAGVTPLFGRNVYGDPTPFIWSTDLGGVGFGSGDLKVWVAAGWNLYWFCVPPLCPDRRVPAAELNVVTHSHGLQVALAAAANGLKIDTLLSVAGPVRKDMREVTAQARKNIRYWVHLHSDKSDRWQWFGTLFDGKIGIVREHPSADLNIKVPQVGHSEMLREPARFPLWTELGLWEVLR